MKTRNIKFKTLQISISKRLLVLLVSVFSFGIGRSQATDPMLTTLFQNSCKVIDAMRLSGGIYLDALALGGAGAKPAALNANGVGLISLCISDAMYKKTGDAINWDANAESKALKTINEWIRLKNTPGATNVNGLFHRYFKPSDGSWVWVTEHSTIDNAILAAGFLFCRNYFNKNAEIVENANILLKSMDFTAAVPPSGKQLYMILDDDGKGSDLVSAFNEYMILAWFAKNSNPTFPDYERAQQFWTTVYSNAESLPKYSYPIGNPTLSEGSFAQPSFHVQFCFYYCHYFGKNADYMKYFKNMAKSDKTWWETSVLEKTAWGCGAGEDPGGGYSANAVNNNSQRIVSPHIIAGFSPVNPEVWRDLITMYAEGKGNGIYKIPGTNLDFQWRYKLKAPTQRTSYVQAVDFSTMLYGLAALPMYLGPDFFTRYNDFNFDPSTTTSKIRNNKGSMSCYPNPFDSQTKIEFELYSKSKVVVDVFTLSGQKICQLVNDEYPAGIHSVMWNTRNTASARVDPGLYICRMQLDDQQTASFQIQLLK